MSTLINVIHPHLYKFVGSDFYLGHTEKLSSRNQKIHDLITSALDNGANVICQRYRGSLQITACDCSLSLDPHFEFLEDSRVKTVYTSDAGIPEDPLFEYDHKLTTNQELSDFSGEPDVALYIGGFFERCLRQSMLHFRKRIRDLTKIHYVNDFCIYGIEEEREKSLADLEGENITPISLETAYDFLGQKSPTV
jgi:hypothetical protein